MIDWRFESSYVLHILRAELDEIAKICFLGSHNVVRETSKFPTIHELINASALGPLTSSPQLLWRSRSIIIWWATRVIRVASLALTIKGSCPTLDHLSPYQVSPRRSRSNTASSLIDV